MCRSYLAWRLTHCILIPACQCICEQLRLVVHCAPTRLGNNLVSRSSMEYFVTMSGLIYGMHHWCMSFHEHDGTCIPTRSLIVKSLCWQCHLG